MKGTRTAIGAVVALLALATSARADDPFWSLLEPRDEPVLTAPQTGEGEAFLTVRAHHRVVGILENDIRGTGIVNSDRIVIPRGTPLYYAGFATSGSRLVPGRSYEGWCGVVTENGREKGYCMLRQGGGYVLGVLPRNGSFYAPTRLADYGLRPITTPQVRADDAARAQLPEITFTYALDAWRPGGVVLERHAIIGAEAVDLGSIFVDRDNNGAATIRIGAQAFTLTPQSDGEAVAIAASE